MAQEPPKRKPKLQRKDPHSNHAGANQLDRELDKADAYYRRSDIDNRKLSAVGEVVRHNKKPESEYDILGNKRRAPARRFKN